jgi:hypothetical protein
MTRTADKPDRNGPGTIEPSGGAHWRTHLQPRPTSRVEPDEGWAERVPRSACWDRFDSPLRQQGSVR